MNNYELTVILEGKTTSAKKKSFLEGLDKIVKIFEGKVKSAEDWGVKEMFHEIKKQKTGLYLHLNIEMPAKSVKGFETKLRTDDSVLRHLIVVVK
ncbi:MAG: 30S ribosomal protein S6 [bacterium]|nr:MAG: 30S ribosomal protein S6 [bacterium]